MTRGAGSTAGGGAKSVVIAITTIKVEAQLCTAHYGSCGFVLFRLRLWPLRLRLRLRLRLLRLCEFGAMLVFLARLLARVSGEHCTFTSLLSGFHALVARTASATVVSSTATPNTITPSAIIFVSSFCWGNAKTSSIAKKVWSSSSWEALQIAPCARNARKITTACQTVCRSLH